MSAARRELWWREWGDAVTTYMSGVYFSDVLELRPARTRYLLPIQPRSPVTSTKFARFCADRRVRTSPGRIGVWWDNADAKSFLAALKNEMYHRHCWPTRAPPRPVEYIEVLYNRRQVRPALATAPQFDAPTDQPPHPAMHRLTRDTHPPPAPGPSRPSAADQGNHQGVSLGRRSG
jgi:transposase InsO family protein